MPVPCLRVSLQPGTPVLPGTQAVSGHVLLRFLSGACVTRASACSPYVAVGILYNFDLCSRPDVVPVTINKHAIKRLKQRDTAMIFG